MATTWKAPTWRMPNEKNQSKFESYSLDFNGSSDHIDTNYTPPASWFNNGFSISAWVYPTSPNNDTIIGAYSGKRFYWRLYDTNKWWVGFGGWNNATTVNSVTSDEWQHVVLTYTPSDTTIRFYRNGAADGSIVQNLSGATMPGLPLAIGVTNQSSNAGYFDGSISDTTLFDYTLSESQISSLYNSGSPINPMTLKPAPIAYYPLGGNASTGGDSTNTLSVPNVAVPDASVFDFDGSTPDFINCGNSSVFDFTTQITISAWVKTTDQDSINNIVKKDDGASNRGWNLSWRGSSGGGSRLVFWNWSTDGTYNYLYTTGTPASNFADGNWHHVVATYDGTADANGAKIYLDGVLMSQGAVSRAGTGLKITTEPVEIGDGISANISNTQLWNTALTSTEIETLYNSGVPLMTGTQPEAANLKAWYKLNQSANWEADTSSNWQIPDAVSSYPQSFNFKRISGTEWGRIYAPTPTSFDDKISVSGWIRIDTTGSTNYQFIVAQDDSSSNRCWSLGLNSSANNQLWYVIYNADGTANYEANWTGTGIRDDKWHHVALIYDGTSNTNGIKLFLDGKLEVQNTASSTGIFSSTVQIGIGNSSSSSQQAPLFNSDLSNIQIWDTDLTYGTVTNKGDTAGGQVAQLYNNGTPLTTAIATDNLKAWYKLDNTATFSTNWSVPDASGNGNTGTSSGMTEQNLVNNNVSALNGESSGMDTSNLVTSTLTRQIPYNSYSLNFDSGSSDYIECGDSDIFSFGNGSSDSPFSISAWVNFDDVSTSVGIISKYANTNATREWLFYIAAQNFRLLLQDESYNNFATATSTTISTNQWYHVVGTYNGVGGANANQGMNIYVNGQPQTLSYAGSSNYVAMHNTDAIVRIARYGTGGYMSGKQSNISIFNKELTSTEVVKLYNSGVPGNLSNFNPSPISWWSLGSDSYFNGSSWICPDLVNTNNGTSTNMDDDALIGDAPNSTANGTSTNMAIDANLTGSAPNSSNNSFSVNMDYADRETSVPS